MDPYIYIYIYYSTHRIPNFKGKKMNLRLKQDSMFAHCYFLCLRCCFFFFFLSFQVSKAQNATTDPSEGSLSLSFSFYFRQLFCLRFRLWIYRKFSAHISHVLLLLHHIQHLTWLSFHPHHLL
jgi:hypothetical protein